MAALAFAPVPHPLVVCQSNVRSFDGHLGILYRPACLWLVDGYIGHGQTGICGCRRWKSYESSPEVGWSPS